MKISAKVFKRKSGKSAGKFIVRISYQDPLTGRFRHLERHAEKKHQAIDIRDKKLAEIRATHGQSPSAERITFSQLADSAKETYFRPAVILDGQKIAGIKSHKTVIGQLDTLNEFFGKMPIQSITSDTIEKYKEWRYAKGSRRGKPKDSPEPIKAATLNRELAALRKIMRHALSRGWVLRDVFFNTGAIDTSREQERHRLLSRQEEERLLAACISERKVTREREKDKANNPDLKAIILMALDSGMRRAEILKMRWQDIDFDNNVVTIIGSHTKTERERLTPMSDRAKNELLKLKPLSQAERVFPITDFKRSWATAKSLAGIEDLRFHDLRRTAVTRWLQEGVPLAFAGKYAGHTQLQTTLKHYAATDLEMVKETVELMRKATI